MLRQVQQDREDEGGLMMANHYSSQQTRSPFANGTAAPEVTQSPAAPTGAADTSMNAEIGLLTSLLGRHLQQLAQPQPATESEYFSHSAPPGVTAADADETSYAGSPAPGATDVAAVEQTVQLASATSTKQGQRVRRRNTDSSMEKLQALADMSEERLAKQEKRMMKNRESAARSRMRRQQHIEQLEGQNAALNAEVAHLHSQVAALQARVADLEWQLHVATAAAAVTSPPAQAAAASTPPAVSPAAGTTPSLSQLSLRQPGATTSLQLPSSLSLGLPPVSSLLLPPLPLQRSAAAAAAAGTGAAFGSNMQQGVDAAAADALAALLLCSRRGSSTDAARQPAAVPTAAAAVNMAATAGGGDEQRSVGSADVAAAVGLLCSLAGSANAPSPGAEVVDAEYGTANPISSRTQLSPTAAVTAAAAAVPVTQEAAAADTAQQQGQQQSPELSSGVMSLLTAALSVANSKAPVLPGPVPCQPVAEQQQHQQQKQQQLMPSSAESLAAFAVLLNSLQQQSTCKADTDDFQQPPLADATGAAAIVGGSRAAATANIDSVGNPAGATSGLGLERPFKRVCP